MTNTNRFNRRKVAAFGIALASVAALATTNTAQADIGPDVLIAGDARVLPAIVGPDGFSTAAISGDGVDQPAPVIALGAADQPAASAQIRFHNQWRSGDRVLFQVRDSAGANCANVAKSIGYSAGEDGTAAPDVVSSDSAYVFNQAADGPLALSNPPAGDNGSVDSPIPDVPVKSTTQAIKPEFQVKLISSTQCAANNVKDIVEILFTNEGAFVDANSDGIDDVGNAVATDVWLFTMTDIMYNVGSEVTAGPLRNLPLAQNATATPGIFENTMAYFGGNKAATGANPLVQNLWTTTAFVLPVTLAATNPNALVADTFTQDIGSITLRESAPGTFVTGEPYEVCYSEAIGDITSTVTATGATVISTSGNCIRFAVTGTAGIDTVVLSNIFAPVVAAGAVEVFLDDVPDSFTMEFLTAEDNNEATPSTSVNSDVNTVETPLLTTSVSVAASVPDRIGGANRFETATKIASNLGNRPTGACTEHAVLVNGNSAPDALSATYLAGAIDTFYDGTRFEGDDSDVPILLTAANSIPQATIVALRELGVRNVYIVGGTTAVSQQVEDQLLDTRSYVCGGRTFFGDVEITVDRYAGDDRYATNNAVVEAAQSVFLQTYNLRLRYQATQAESSKRTAILATGENSADALTAGPLAYGAETGDRDYGFPLILTTSGTLSPDALRTMVNIDIEQVVIFGGENAVSAGVAAAIEAEGITVIRLAGANRYGTNVAVNNWALAPEFTGTASTLPAGTPYGFGLGQSIRPGYVFMARADGNAFADALASAPLVSSKGTLLVLTEQNTLPTETKTFLASAPVDAAIDQVIGLGLGAAISTSVLNEANATVN